MGVAPRRGGETASGCVVGGLPVEALETHGCVEGFERRKVEVVENLLADSGPEPVIGMGCDGDPPALPDGGDDFGGRFSLHVREGGAEAEKVAVGRGDLDSRNDQESLHGLAVGSDEPLAGETLDRFAGIVVSDGNATQSSVFGRPHHGLGRTAGIRRVMGVQMKIKGVEHGWKPIISPESWVPEKGNWAALQESLHFELKNRKLLLC